jgi:4-amino-4-deoxy-L-arabinose transferase-like glycosyltransferase
MTNQETAPGAATSEILVLRALLVCGVLAGFFLNIHAVPLFDLDEGAFSEATREMFLRGDFISTYLNGAPRYDKPILIYWLQALSTTVFGFTELGFRLPSALASVAWVGVIYAFARRMRGERTALYAALMTATALQISIIGRAAIADALLNLLVTVAMFAVYLYYSERRRRYLYAAFAAMALGFLTKGPVAVLIPLAVSLMFFSVRREFRAWLRAALDPRAIALFILIAAPWYVAQYLKEGQAFVEGFFFTHNVGRFKGPMEGHAGSLLYYLPVVLVGLLPYTTLLLKTLGGIRSAARDDLELFLWLWFAFVLLFFSLSGTKLPHYVVYGYPGIIVLMAMRMDSLRSAVLGLLPALLLFVFLAGLPELVAYARGRVDDAFTGEVLAAAAQMLTPGYRIAMITAAAGTVALMALKAPRLPVRLGVAGVGLAAVLWAVIVPLIGALQQSPIKEAAMLARERDYHVVMWHLNTPSFMVYSERLVERRDPRNGDIVLTKTPYLDRLPGYETLYRKNGIALVRVTAP